MVELTPFIRNDEKEIQTVILSRQSFPSDTESADTKAENSAATTETSLQTSDMEQAKAPATPHTSLQTDVAGITKPERQEQAERRILRTDEPIHSDEPQPTKDVNQPWQPPPGITTTP